MQKLGGRLISFYFCYGEYDIVAIGELPDDSAATAVALAAMSQGHLKAYKTTKLFTVEETMEATRRSVYSPHKFFPDRTRAREK